MVGPPPVANNTVFARTTRNSPLRMSTNNTPASASPSRDGSRASVGSRTGHHDRATSGGLDAVGVLHVVGEVHGLLQGQAGDLVAHLGDLRVVGLGFSGFFGHWKLRSS